MISKRETYILIANEDGLFPANFIYPSDDLFPVDAGMRQVSNIVAGSLKLDELIAENVPQFGQMFATKFECKVYFEEDLSGKFIRVYQQNDGVYSDVFAGKIDSCKLDKVGTDRTLVAYDLAYEKGQQNIADWWTTFWVNRETATLKQVRESMLDSVGLAYEDVTLPNDSLQVTKTVDITSCTMTAMLKMICELNYCFPHLDRDGYLTFIMLNTEATPIDLSNKYEWMNSTFEEYVTSEITGVQFFDSGNELKYTVGDTTNAYPIRKNIFLYEKSTEVLQSIGSELLNYLQDFNFTPAKLKMIIGDFDLQLGDYVHTEKGDFYILQNSYSGSQFIEQTITAKGSELLYGGTANFDYEEIILNEKIARVKQTVEAFEVDYRDFKEGTAANFQVTSQAISSEVTRATTAEENLSSRITQTAEDITSEVTRATTAEGSLSSRITQNADSITSEVTRATQVEGSLSSRITQTSEAISSEVTRATTAEGQLDSKITQTAESISLEVTNGSDSSTIKLKLGQTELSSKVIQMTGLVKFTDLSTSGSTTINGSNITTGTIDASKVSVTNLNASNITTGTISANKIKGGQLTIDAESGYTSAIVVKVNNSEYINISRSKGIVVGESWGTYKTTITGNGITVGSNGVVINGDVSGGAITVGSSSSKVSIKNGQIVIDNMSYTGGGIVISSNGKGMTISAGSNYNAIEVSQGTTNVKSFTCTSFNLTSGYSTKSYSPGSITMITGSSSSFNPGFSEIQDVELDDTTLWAVDASSAPSMKGNYSDGYNFSSSPTWKKIALKKSSYSTKVYGVTGGSSASTPQLTSKTVLVQD